MHGVEKQELMHHFLESAGRAGSRPTCRRPIRPQRRGAPRRRNKGQRGTEHHAHPAVSPSAPKGVVPRDEGIRASDVLPVNRTMKKYKICVTIILNFLLVIF